MTNDAKERHVYAHIIVTRNRRHFPADAFAPYGTEAQSADTFLNSLCLTDPDTVARIIIEQSERLQNPPQPVERVLDNLSARSADIRARDSRADTATIIHTRGLLYSAHIRDHL